MAGISRGDNLAETLFAYVCGRDPTACRGAQGSGPGTRVSERFLWSWRVARVMRVAGYRWIARAPGGP